MRFSWPAAGGKFWGSEGFELLPPLVSPGSETRGGNNSRIWVDVFEKVEPKERVKNST